MEQIEDGGRSAENRGHSEPAKDRGSKGNLPNWEVSLGKGTQTV